MRTLAAVALVALLFAFVFLPMSRLFGYPIAAALYVVAGLPMILRS
jgi:hypothetical protein